MAESGTQSSPPPRRSSALQTTSEEEVPGGAFSVPARKLEAFGRKMTATAGQLIRPVGDAGSSGPYAAAMGGIQKELRQPERQRRVFSLARASPTELMRSKLSTSEIQYRALTYLPDELLANVPENNNPYSLFQGFQATLPNHGLDRKHAHRRHGSRGRKLLPDQASRPRGGPPSLENLKTDKDSLAHRLQMLGVRKSMCSSEIREVDGKLSNLQKRRRVVLDKLAELEQQEALMERDLLELDNRIEDVQEEMEQASAASPESQRKVGPGADVPHEPADAQETEATFMSESIYEKLPSPKSKRMRTTRRKSMPILHEHIEPGSRLEELEAHTDMITALDFDAPFGTMVTAALDDTVRVWDLSAGRCMGMLEGHHASVRCLQVEDNIVATGSTDASIRIWDLGTAEYQPRQSPAGRAGDDSGWPTEADQSSPAAGASQGASTGLQDCFLFSLEAHVDEVTALHFHKDVLVSGSADKTLRQWDLTHGRCVQTLDVLWAAAQASATMQQGSSNGHNDVSNNHHNYWRQAGRLPDASADFVGALQCFDAALACGTADGMVRLWDLRSGQVHRSLVGHTGPVTALQFDDVHLVTGSLDRSIRIWDLRTGSIFDAFAYDQPVTSMQFDTRRIVAAAGEPVVKVYDKTDGRHWDCGTGVLSGQHTPLSGAEASPVVAHDPFLTAPSSSASGASHRRNSSSSSTSAHAPMPSTVGAIDGRPQGPSRHAASGAASGARATVQQVRIKDGYLVEGRKDGMVGMWAC